MAKTSSYALASLLVLAAGPARAQAPSTGDLVILTTPSGATIAIDGSAIGRSPITGKNLLPGEHLVEAAWPGGASANTVAVVTAGKSSLVKLAAPAAPATTTTPTTAPPPPPPTETAPPPPPPEPNAEQPKPINAPLPAQTPDASGNANQEGSAVLLRDPVLSPFHPQRRHLRGLAVAPGFYCPDINRAPLASTEWCSFRLRLATDFSIGDFHVNFLFGSAVAFGLQIGLELGTPYFQIGGARSPFALAIRATLDPVFALTNRADNLMVVFNNTYGPNLSFAITHRISVEARFGVGWMLATASNGSYWTGLRASWALDGWLGVRYQP